MTAPSDHALTAPFDALADSYDESFSRSAIGSLLRARVWRHFDRVFAPGDRVLDLGCGTGEDALHLASRGVHVLATDASVGMVEVTRTKVGGAGELRGSVEVRHLPAERIAELRGWRPPPSQPIQNPASAPDERGTGVALTAPTRDFLFDGVVSSFGVINCVEDLPALAKDLADLTSPGARVFLGVMGPLVPWEWGWYLWRGKRGNAVRRLASNGVPWRGMRIRYPSIQTTRSAFSRPFRPISTIALGTLMPPTYAESWAVRHPRLLGQLNAIEQVLERLPPMPWLADHYVLELGRK